MQKKLLIAGCSHAAGSEIDGEIDSLHNRNHSFGNLLARKLGMIPVNIAIGGATNDTISRSVLNYVTQFDVKNHEYFVLISWTDSSRIETPIDWLNGHIPKFADWLDETSKNFLRINQGCPPSPIDKENILIDYWKKFTAENHEWLQIQTLKMILMTQYFLQSRDIPYVMCNGGWTFNIDKSTNDYVRHLDITKYFEYNDPQKCFITKFRNKGFVNKKARYWHHGQEPHEIYSQELLSFINDYR